jgi:hypothetical protein
MPEIPDEDKNRRLHEYARKGLTGGVLMALRADINAEDSRGRTPLYCVIAPGTIARGRCSGSTAPSEGACRGARRTRRRLFITTNVK